VVVLLGWVKSTSERHSQNLSWQKGSLIWECPDLAPPFLRLYPTLLHPLVDSFFLFGLASFQAMNRDPNKWVRLKGGISFGPQIVTYNAKVNHFGSVSCGGNDKCCCAGP